MPEWYYAKDGAQIGPFTEDVFLKMLAQGSINRATKVWREGFPEWTTLGQTDLVPRTNAALPPPSTYFQPNRQYGADSSFGRRVLRPFIDLSGLTSLLTILFYITAVVSAVAMVSDAWQYHLMHTVNPAAMDPDQLKNIVDSNDNRQELIAIVKLILFVGAGILFLMWLNQANKNIRSLGAENLRFTPDWAVGWWFVPVISLIRPFQIMTEIWKGSANPHSWENERSDNRIAWWWCLFVAMDFLNGVSVRYMLYSEQISGAEFGTLLSMFANIAAIWSAYLAPKIINEVWANQKSCRDRSSSGVTQLAASRR